MVEEVDRLRRRADRERSARLQAESIAERAIADLTEVNRALDDTVAARTADLESALRRLAAADEVKSTFLRGVAHEMSTPLHAVLGLLELIERSDDASTMRRSAKEAGQAAERLHAALRTLVEFAAASGGGVTTSVEQRALGGYADAVADRWRRGAARRGLLLMVEVAPDPNLVVPFDPVRLDQIIDALMANAVRYGRTRVEVSLSLDSGSLIAVIADDGPGPPPELGERMFDAFSRGDRSGEGFGVGLTLARLVAEAMGGTLVHRPMPGTDARFVAEIPVEPSQPSPILTQA